MTDALIDEVRTLRREFVASTCGDIDALALELHVIEEKFQARTGRFAGVPQESAGELFPERNKPLGNPVVDEVRDRVAG